MKRSIPSIARWTKIFHRRVTENGHIYSQTDDDICEDPSRFDLIFTSPLRTLTPKLQIHINASIRLPTHCRVIPIPVPLLVLRAERARYLKNLNITMHRNCARFRAIGGPYDSIQFWNRSSECRMLRRSSSEERLKCCSAGRGDTQACFNGCPDGKVYVVVKKVLRVSQIDDIRDSDQSCDGCARATLADGS